MTDFIQQLHALQLKTPHLGEVNIGLENSPYCQYSGYTKNCYLLIGSEHDEDCYYGNWLYFCRDCVDCKNTYKCELCYECTDCENCYGCVDCQDCKFCQDCENCFDCRSCQNCYGCAGLRNKQYYFLNEKLSKEEYEARMKEEKPSSEEVFQKTPRVASRQINTENCTGDYIQNSKNAHYCFEVKELEDCSFCDGCIQIKDCYECSNCYFGCELSYEIMSAIQLVNCNFCYSCHYCSDCEHCEQCFNCDHCFGCVGLHKKKYHILNEPYSREEYLEKIRKIKAANDLNKYILANPYPYEDSKAYQLFGQAAP